jgi:hypothetical protein
MVESTPKKILQVELMQLGTIPQKASPFLSEKKTW